MDIFFERLKGHKKKRLLSYQQRSDFLGSWASREHSSGKNRLKARVQLDKRRIKLIRPRSESNRALQSVEKPDAGARLR